MSKLIHGGDIYTTFEKGLSVVDFSSNINPLGVPKSIKDSIVASIDMCSNYPDPLCREIGKALSEKISVNKEHIIFGNGAADLIFRLIQAEKPKRALLLAPTFSEYEKALVSVDCVVKHYYLAEEKSFILDNAFLNHIDSGMDMIILCNPNNPTGQLIDKELLKTIVEKCQSKNIRLLLDECFIDFVSEMKQHTMIEYLEKLPAMFILRSFTKSYAMPGIRLGYGLCSDTALLNKILEHEQPWSVSLLAQKAGLASIKEDDYLEDARTIIISERKRLENEFNKLGFKVFSPAANYLFFKLRENMPMEYIDSFKSDMENEGFLIRCCANYEGLQEGFFRIAILGYEENNKLINAIKRRESEWQKQ